MMIYLYETLYLKGTLLAVAGSRGKIILSAAIFYIRWTVLSMFSCTNLQCNVYIAMFTEHSLSRINLMVFCCLHFVVITSNHAIVSGHVERKVIMNI